MAACLIHVFPPSYGSVLPGRRWRGRLRLSGRGGGAAGAPDGPSDKASATSTSRRLRKASRPASRGGDSVIIRAAASTDHVGVWIACVAGHIASTADRTGNPEQPRGGERDGTQ